jgi:TonB family protein
MLKTKVLTMLVMACWFAQAQIVADGAGVTVNLNGSQLMHRTGVAWPAEALAKGVEGTVVVQVRLDPNGEVLDDTVLSGPDELRKSVQQSVLNWHFEKSAASTTRVVNIDFAKPANAPAVPMPAQVRVMAAPRSGTIDKIDVTGLSDTATAGLLAQLPVHAGDPITADTVTRAAEVARQFDSHLIVGMNGGPSGTNVMTIRPQGAAQAVISAAPPQPNLAVRPGAAMVAGNVEASNLINSVTPIYPPLAKMARQQGTVKFQATIGKDGAMEDLMLISGPPLLVQSAMDAVKKWTYKPLVLNGAPVEVVTTVDVNFSLTE